MQALRISRTNRTAGGTTNGARELLLAGACAAVISVFPATPAFADFTSCMNGLRASFAKSGISGATFDRVMAGVTPDTKVIDSLNSQPEFKTPIWDYLAFLVDAEKVADGRAAMRQHSRALAAAERKNRS